MTNENEISLQEKVEKAFQNTCGSWENCTQSTIQSFLQECFENNIDPQFCMSWVEKHSGQIPEWSEVSMVSLDWMNQHTSS
ncbi:hypothetical protein [Bacillus massilinigeriensis]|uniref:hypothetical protein n=1 Tax=Bacillus massilionigeriensis TaxID=1805475 RepID=UPI00096B3A93|nr:hypothetical protein [Bacillus massilionigeriensis]